MRITVSYDLEVIARVAYEAVREVDWLLTENETAAWDDLDATARAGLVEGVRRILDRPTASEKNWHNAWRVRNRTMASPAELEEYENLDPVHRLKIRLWRHVVHAFIG